MYGNESSSSARVFECLKSFQTSLEDIEGSSHPDQTSTSTTDGDFERLGADTRRLPALFQIMDRCRDRGERILFSDEAHFWLNGYVNKQNCRIWSETNPQVYVETQLHPQKLTVWCALWAGGIIDPYFFKNDEGHNVTVNGDRYRPMITNFFIPELNNHDVQELWFQQDGATCHTARAKNRFLERHVW
ncbi:putative transposable element [Trichonephila clavipes]|nr:putative transposable element [Trichonephila clavipes]